MGNKLVDLPMKLLAPSPLENIKEIAFKTIPSASKIEIKRVVESMYGFQVEKVNTLNMQGKKKRSGGRMISKPNYKKAYITLKKPISLAFRETLFDSSISCIDFMPGPCCDLGFVRDCGNFVVL